MPMLIDTANPLIGPVPNATGDAAQFVLGVGKTRAEPTHGEGRAHHHGVAELAGDDARVDAVTDAGLATLARWMAADLYLRDVDNLAAELSMQQASDELRAQVGESAEPYRALLKQLRERLRETRSWAQQALTTDIPASRAVLQDNRDLLAPLHEGEQPPPHAMREGLTAADYYRGSVDS